MCELQNLRLMEEFMVASKSSVSELSCSGPARSTVQATPLNEEEARKTHGRHGFLSTYEAFAQMIDSMFNQHTKWRSICNELSWRQNIASLNLLITSTVWRQDHNGVTYQNHGFLDVIVKL